jgi:hypothetical protein
MPSTRAERYFQGIRRETPVCRIFQDYLESKNNTKTYLTKRPNTNASIDFIWREYSSENNQTIRELAVEVRTLNRTSIDIENSSSGYVEFPITKLNECMMFWRMGKWVYIVYELTDMVGVLDWDYYLGHNFELSKDHLSILLPIRNFIKIG